MNRIVLSILLTPLFHLTPVQTMEFEDQIAQESSSFGNSIVTTVLAGVCLTGSFYLFKLLLTKTPQEKLAILQQEFDDIQKFLKQCDHYLPLERSLGNEIKKTSPKNTQDIQAYEERLLTILMSHHHQYSLSYPLYFYAEEISTTVQKIEYSLALLTTITRELEILQAFKHLATDTQTLKAQCMQSIGQFNILHAEFDFVKGIIINKPRYEKERKIEAKNSHAYAFSRIHPHQIYIPTNCYCTPFKNNASMYVNIW